MRPSFAHRLPAKLPGSINQFVIRSVLRGRKPPGGKKAPVRNALQSQARSNREYSGPATSENFLDKEESNLIIKIAGRETCRRNRSRVLRTCAEGASPCRKRMAGFRQLSALGRQSIFCGFQRRALHDCGRADGGKGRSGAGGTEKKGGARFDRNGPTMAASQKKSRTAGQEGECKSHEY